MKIAELVLKMETAIEKDLSYNRLDHPYCDAIRALEQCYDDIDFLRKVVKHLRINNSKRAIRLLDNDYDPDF